MESRRDRFRRHLERLAGAGSPKEAIEQGFYVPRPNSSKRLVDRIELQPTAVRVLTGPIGCGKSTEMLVLAEELNRLTDFWALVIDVSLWHDLRDLREGTLVAAAGVGLQERFGVEGEHVDQLRSFAYGGPISPSEAFFDALFVKGSRKVSTSPAVKRGILSLPEQQSSPVWRLAQTLGQVLKEIPETRGLTPVLIFDSLDRVQSTVDFRTVLEKDARALCDQGIGVILTAPIDTLWEDSEALRTLAETWDTLPYEDPESDSNVRSFFIDILQRRTDLDMIPEPEREALVSASGGVLRDLIELARGAVEEAYLGGRDAVSSQDVQASVAQLAHALSIGMGTATIDELAYVKTRRQIKVMDERTVRMLKNRQILEHRNDSGTYYLPHPVLDPLIERSAKAS